MDKLFFIFSLIGLVIVDISLILNLGRWTVHLIPNNKVRRIHAFVLAQVVCATPILLGVYGEARWGLHGILRNLMSKESSSPAEVHELQGDPGLVQWVRNQRPNLPRPNFRTAEAFRKWQASLHHVLIKDVFTLPHTNSPEEVRFQEISSTIVVENITRTFLFFESFDGTRIPAYLFLPSTSGPLPAILVLHGHPEKHQQEEGITQTAGIVNSYQHGVALELAKAGYVTLTLEFRGFGFLGSQVSMEHRFVAYNAILGGSFYKALISRDIKYALELMLSMKAVDPQRIGITGVSFGGEMAVTYAALDKRIKVIIFQGFGGAVGPNRGATGKVPIHRRHYCHIIPGHNKYLFEEDLFLLIAPRPLLGVRGSNESGNHRRLSEVVAKGYSCLGASSALRFEVAPGNHEYFIQPAIEFFRQHL